MEKDSTLPIGVFDSGVGGMTVVARLGELLPHEDIVYLGDTARMPYGEKSEAEIRQYASEDAAFLLGQPVKLIICACNTASAIGIADLRVPVPVVGMLNNKLSEYLSAQKPAKILVAATRATVASHAYAHLITSVLPNAVVTELACPLLAPLVEEGLAQTPIARETIEHYVAEVLHEKFDVVVLGCTHYPLLKNHFEELFPGSKILDSGSFAAYQAKEILHLNNLEAPQNKVGKMECFVTDQPERFDSVKEIFLQTSGVSYPPCTAKLVV
jgi:glutamate racemase